MEELCSSETWGYLRNIPRYNRADRTVRDVRKFLKRRVSCNGFMVEGLSYTVVLGVVTFFYDSEASYTANLQSYHFLTWERN
jgi:hypothetical protein